MVSQLNVAQYQIDDARRHDASPLLLKNFLPRRDIYNAVAHDGQVGEVGDARGQARRNAGQMDTDYCPTICRLLAAYDLPFLIKNPNYASPGEHGIYQVRNISTDVAIPRFG